MSKEIKLHTGEIATVDDSDFEKASKLKWYIHRCNPGSTPYAYGYNPETRKCIMMHRYLLEGKSQLDHINGDGLDNRRENLRPCNHRQNQMNNQLSKRNTSGYKGVSKYGQRWIASIIEHKKPFHIGVFETKEEAARAYDEEALKRFGEYARTNEMMGLLKPKDKKEKK